jgi:hypothetical protein
MLPPWQTRSDRSTTPGAAIAKSIEWVIKRGLRVANGSKKGFCNLWEKE